MVFLYLINLDGLMHLYIKLRFCSLTNGANKKNAWLEIPFKGLTYRF